MSQPKYLNLNRQDANIAGAGYTATEITGQPELWEQVFNLVTERKESLEAFLNPLLNLQDLRIILTGAGSSAFIGESVQGIVQLETQRLTQAIATTDLITHPASFFLKEVPTLLISFARSGNSPESIETINLANAHCNRLFHLIITCNENGKLIENSNFANYFIFMLPDTANDKGLAMTGSFTSMLLSVMLIAKLSKLENLTTSFNNLKVYAQKIIDQYAARIQAVAKGKYERVIFLGAGPLLGIARECHLKLQELTDGQVICKHDSFLGFRHGPRVVINEQSLIVYLFSNNDKVFQYEKDLALSIAEDTRYFPTVCFGRRVAAINNSILDIEFEKPLQDLDIFYPVAATLIGQLLGFYMSLELGLRPDTPSVTGVINRVVEGVTIYSVSEK